MSSTPKVQYRAGDTADAGVVSGYIDVIEALMRYLIGLSAALLSAANAHAQLAITTFGATEAQACYDDARSESATSIDSCDAALGGQALTKRDRLATLVNRGIIHNRAERLTQALADFNAALNEDAVLGEAWLNRGNTWFLAGKYDRALADYEKALGSAVSEPWTAWYNIGLAREALTDLRGARTAYERSLELNPNFAPAEKKLGMEEPPAR